MCSLAGLKFIKSRSFAIFALHLPSAPVDNSHFEYMKVVGKGGFGKVNAVIKKSTNEFFAIKRVNKFEVLKKDPTLYTVGIEFDIMTRVQSPFCLLLVNAFERDR